MISGRGRGVRPGAVSIKVERVVRNQESQEGGEYEDEVVYVTEGPRRRGRPRKPATVTPRPQPKPAPLRYPRSNEVIYVSAARGRPQYTQVRSPVRPCVIHQPPCPLSVCAAMCPRPVRCVVTGLPSAGQTIVNIPKPVLTLGVQRAAETKIDWPGDLQELVADWDSLPERRTRDVVKWFQTVSGKSQLPGTVREIQEMWASMAETWGEKADLALEWLREREPPKRSAQLAANSVLATKDIASTSNGGLSRAESVLAPVSRAKVLVEAQPNPIQNCGQWSSMAENGGSRNH